MSNYPEHDKLKKAKAEGSEEVQRFLDWLLDDKEYVLGTYKHGDSNWNDVLLPVHFSREVLMAQFYGIDLYKLNDEKLAMLDAFLDKQNEVQ